MLMRSHARAHPDPRATGKIRAEGGLRVEIYRHRTVRPSGLATHRACPACADAFRKRRRGVRTGYSPPHRGQACRCRPPRCEAARIRIGRFQAKPILRGALPKCSKPPSAASTFESRRSDLSGRSCRSAAAGRHRRHDWSRNEAQAPRRSSVISPKPKSISSTPAISRWRRIAPRSRSSSGISSLGSSRRRSQRCQFSQRRPLRDVWRNVPLAFEYLREFGGLAHGEIR